MSAMTRLDAEHRIAMLEQSLREANTQIEKLSVIDPLVGIFNRRYLVERLPQEAARSRRYGQSLSLVMAGIEQTGDLVLQHTVNLAKSVLRGSDWIARYGGEEFVIVLPETPLSGAYAVAERMRRMCSETRFGVATIDGAASSNEDAEALLRKADKALYAIKRCRLPESA